MRVQLIGAGSWGLALARVLAKNGQDVRVWCREEDGLDQLQETRESPIFLPGIKLPPSVEVSRDVDYDAEIAVFAVPSHVMRAAAEAHPFGKKTVVVTVAKGIEEGAESRIIISS